jgi:hypothetical protein
MKYYLMANEADVVVTSGTHVGGFGGGTMVAKNEQVKHAVPYVFDLGDFSNEICANARR